MTAAAGTLLKKHDQRQYPPDLAGLCREGVRSGSGAGSDESVDRM